MHNTFTQLDQLLTGYANFWRGSAFYLPQHGGWAEHPELHAWLMTLSDDEVDCLQGDDHMLCQRLAPLFPVAQLLYQLIQLPVAEQHLASAGSYAWQRDVPGRKIAQIEAFASALGAVSDPLVEWCSGKLHLGRYLAEQFNLPVLGLELDSCLVRQANQLAQRLNIKANVVQCDVLGTEVRQHLNERQHLLALHACGGLHRSLLSHSIEQQVRRITLAPCCYHRYNSSTHYQALSRVAQASPLQLSNDDLRTAVRQSNTASTTERVKRKKLQVWRLGFDQLQRDLRGVDEYLPVPSLSTRLLAGSFTEFCQHVARVKGCVLTHGLNFDAYEAQGERRFFEYSRLELVRMCFRRALEVWLALDRVMYLEEHGYQCTLTQFCPTLLTPRNLLIDARCPLSHC